jgi:hypothetical protein
MRTFRLATLLPLLLAACSAPLRSHDGVLVRLANESGQSFTEVVVGFPDRQERYGAIGAGEASAYRAVGRAYRYAFVEAHTGDGRRLVLQPIDYVGEAFLARGRYTYVLGTVDGNGSLTLRLRRD